MHALFAAFADTRYSVIVRVIGIQVYVLNTSYFPSEKQRYCIYLFDYDSFKCNNSNQILCYLTLGFSVGHRK